MTYIKTLFCSSIILAGLLLVGIGTYLNDSILILVGLLQFIILISNLTRLDAKLPTETWLMFAITIFYLFIDIAIITLFYMRWWG